MVDNTVAGTNPACRRGVAAAKPVVPKATRAATNFGAIVRGSATNGARKLGETSSQGEEKVKIRALQDKHYMQES